MKTYRYTARNHKGELIKGVVYGLTKSECIIQLRTSKLYPIKLQKVFWAKGGFLNLSKTIKYAEMALFCKQFSALLQAGISIPRALNLLSDQKSSPILQRIVSDLIKGLEQGQSLYQRVVKHEKHLPQFFSSLIRAGEMTNSLEPVLEELASYYNQVDQFRNQIGQLLIYPLILLFSTVGVICFLFLKIIPGFQQIYASLDAELPMVTNCLLTISQNLTLNFKNYLIGFFICAFSLLFVSRYLSKKNWFVLLQYQIPLWGSLKKQLLIAKLARTLALLLENGLEVLQAVELSKGVAGFLIDTFLIQTGVRLKQGVSLTASLKMTGFFPEIFLEMVNIGEESGTMGMMLGKVAEIYEKDSRERIERYVKILEPALLMVIALVTGTIVFSVMIPMFDLIKHF